jgi:hypothetical protein
MGILQWLLKPHRMTDEERRKKGEKLDAQRRHLRGKISKTTGEIQRAWTAYRTWRGDEAGKKGQRARIRELEAERKMLVKRMLKLQAEMKKLGYEAAAGHVDMH